MTRLRVGVTLPTFRDDVGTAIAAAQRAEAAGLDGVFVFDHLWPLGGDRLRPALHSYEVLAAIAMETGRVAIGPLVARVGLLPDAVLVHTLASVERVAPGRLIAGLGTGDRANRPENEAYGVPFAPAAERVARLVDCLRLLRARRIPTWVGGLSDEIRDVAVAEGDAWNLWATTPAEIRQRTAGIDVAVTWGGQVLLGRDDADAADRLARRGQRPGLVHGTPAAAAAHLRELADVGATWAVLAPLDVGDSADAVELVAEAAALAQ